MPGIKKTRIVIASVLKPTDDTRMFEKIGQSLHETGLYDVHIIGIKSIRNTPVGITLHASKPFKRISLARLLQPVKIFRLILSLKPNLLIVTTHELLLTALLSKLLLRNLKVIYDVQENYFLNILYTDAFPFWLKPLVANYLRAKERCLSFAVNLFVLAEKTYAQELAFTKGKSIVVENKLKILNSAPRLKKIKQADATRLLFSGTLAETTGVFKVIDIVKLMHAIESSIQLTIIGYCAQSSILEKLKNEIKHCKFITLIGGDKLVPHAAILKEIQNADFGLIAYTPNLATTNRMPTKLFEYMGYQLPILLTDHTPWVAYCSPHRACIVVNYDQPNLNDILFHLKNESFYSPVPHNVFWEPEAEKLVKSVSALLIKN